MCDFGTALNHKEKQRLTRDQIRGTLMVRLGRVAKRLILRLLAPNPVAFFIPNSQEVFSHVSVLHR